MEKKKRNSVLLLVLLLLVAISASYIAGTYAKYTSEIKDNNGTATVAKWAFASDNDTQSLTIDLAKTYDPTTLVENKIAPGTEGSFVIALSNENSEVGVDFTVKLNSITNKPTNLKFYKDSSYSTELTPGTSEITGQLVAGEKSFDGVKIYWKWAYETDAIATNDPIDTGDGEAANTLTIGVDITGVQTEPSTTAITSHID